MSKAISSKQVVRTSFLVDFTDVALNLSVAILSGSAIMSAEAAQGLADLFATGLLLIGLKRSRRVADQRHQFGFGRELYFWTFMSAIIMLPLSAALSFYRGWDHLTHPHQLSHLGAVLTILIIGVVTNGYAFYVSSKRLKQYDLDHNLLENFLYSDLVETKATFILDAMGVVAALIGLSSLAIYLVTGDPRFDGLGAILIGITIALFAVFLVMEIKDLLIGRSALPEVEADITAAALKVKGVRQILNVRTMYIGSERLLVNMSVDMDRKLTTNSLEQIIDRIKEKVRAEVPTVKHIQVELETDID